MVPTSSAIKTSLNRRQQTKLGKVSVKLFLLGMGLKKYSNKAGMKERQEDYPTSAKYTADVE